jgi:hypothetical protein
VRLAHATQKVNKIRENEENRAGKWPPDKAKFRGARDGLICMGVLEHLSCSQSQRQHPSTSTELNSTYRKLEHVAVTLHEDAQVHQFVMVCGKQWVTIRTKSSLMEVEDCLHDVVSISYRTSDL